MRRPFIAIPAIRSPKIAGLRRSGVVSADRITECVFRAGGEPFLLPPGDDVGRRLRYADGAVVPGGADMDPLSYGAARDPRTGESDPVQDAYDTAFVRALLDYRMPFLAIARGMQVVNVTLGGTLIQHLDENGAVPHREGLHTVTLKPGCATARAIGRDSVEVSSHHHQALDRIGTGLRVVGRAADGCVEVIEHETAPMLAVQWHPEDNADLSPPQQALFDAVVEAAERRMMITTLGRI
ncbi:MAG: gamma-glutamyl-gamma-aminobutyrate hydrolase family protein [Mycobacterium sp.]